MLGCGGTAPLGLSSRDLARVDAEYSMSWAHRNATALGRSQSSKMGNTCGLPVNRAQKRRKTWQRSQRAHRRVCCAPASPRKELNLRPLWAPSVEQRCVVLAKTTSPLSQQLTLFPKTKNQARTLAPQAVLAHWLRPEEERPRTLPPSPAMAKTTAWERRTLVLVGRTQYRTIRYFLQCLG